MTQDSRSTLVGAAPCGARPSSASRAVQRGPWRHPPSKSNARLWRPTLPVRGAQAPRPNRLPSPAQQCRLAQDFRSEVRRIAQPMGRPRAFPARTETRQLPAVSAIRPIFVELVYGLLAVAATANPRGCVSRPCARALVRKEAEIRHRWRKRARRSTGCGVSGPEAHAFAASRTRAPQQALRKQEWEELDGTSHSSYREHKTPRVVDRGDR